jgi:hypothetical protein
VGRRPSLDANISNGADHSGCLISCFVFYKFYIVHIDRIAQRQGVGRIFGCI